MLAWLLNLNFAASATSVVVPAGATLNDAMLAQLIGAGFTGTLNDALMQWFTAAGHTTGTINDRLLAYYISLGADSGSTLNDAARWVWINAAPT